MEFVAILGVVILALVLIALIYRAARTFEAGAHATFITTKGGDYHGALREPTTVWNPSIRVLRDRHAPDISFITCDASGQEYFEKSLVVRRSGEISLRVNTCAPRPFISRSSENRQLRVKARVAFQLDIDRIQIPVQMQSFGALLGARIENLFDNAIGEYENQDVRSRQGEIEAKVLQQLQDIEFPPDPTHPSGMPLGIRVYEAAMSIEPVANASTEGEAAGARGAMSYSTEELDELADMLEKANPATVDTIMKMMELQTRHNIVEMLCKSGGLVAFTAPELGLSERPLDRKISGANRMTPVPKEEIAPATSPSTLAAPSADTPPPPVDAASAYYSKGAPTAG
jgi:hypothetical protein